MSSGLANSLEKSAEVSAVAIVTVVRGTLFHGDRAIKAVDAEMASASANFILVTVALSSAFARVTGAVVEFIATETLAPVLCASVFRTQ